LIIGSGTNGNTIRRVSLASNRVETLAGDTYLGLVDGIATFSRFQAPSGVVLDKETDMIYVSDPFTTFLPL
jgi:hypothetical protein